VEAPASTAELVKKSKEYKKIEAEFARLGAVTLHKVVRISNENLNRLYEAMESTIKRENNGNANEREFLFHGTSSAGADGIEEYGFDNRFYKVGAWGPGAYFADTVLKSHGFTDTNSTTKEILVCKVLLGKQHTMTAADTSMRHPPKGHHSILGTAFKFNEYIIYRYGQAIPVFRVTYSV